MKEQNHTKDLLIKDQDNRIYGINYGMKNSPNMYPKFFDGMLGSWIYGINYGMKNRPNMDQ